MKNILLAIALAAYTGLAATSTNELVVTNFDGTVVTAAEKVKSLEANRRRTRTDLSITFNEWICRIRDCKMTMHNLDTVVALDGGYLHQPYVSEVEGCHIRAEKIYNELMQTIKAVELLSTDEKLRKEAQKTKQKVVEMKAGDKIVKWYDSYFIPKMTARGTPLQ